MAEQLKRIDVHHHITPAFYVDALKSIGITDSYKQPFPKWNPETSISFMKKTGIEKAILSITTPGVCLKDEPFSKELARSCNDFLAKVKEEYPGKFGAFASLPIVYEKSALYELEYALDRLNLDGVALMSNYEEKYLGNEIFENIFHELNKRKAIVFIHPTDPTNQYDPKLGISNGLIEAPFETTRTVANLIYTGVTEKYPDIKYILAHGGGTIPYIGWRLAMIRYGMKDKKTPLVRTFYDFLVKDGPETGLNILKAMYYDTALTSGSYALKALKDFAGPTHIVFGTDFPMAKVAPIVAKNLKNFDGFSNEEHKAIEYRNCERLFN